MSLAESKDNITIAEGKQSTCPLPANVSTFDHAALNLAEKEFRLLRIHPGSDDTIIECDIHTERFGAQPYKALSYTWGDPEQPSQQKHILLNARSFPVRSNLWAFLHAAREKDLTSTRLWIDALCIDQNCIPERNHQVGFMDRIYKEAEGVIVWLGPAGDNSDWNFDTLWSARRSEPEAFKSDVSQIVLEKKSIIALLSRTYWRRIWVIQEIALNRQVFIMCGQKTIGWSDMARLIKEIKGHKLDEANGHHGDLSKQGMAELWNSSHTNHISSLPTVLISKDKIFWVRVGGSGSLRPKTVNLMLMLQNFCNFECTDPLDRVYGLQSLVYPQQRMEVDYSKTLDDLFFDVMQKVMGLTRVPPSYMAMFEQGLRKKWDVEDQGEELSILDEIARTREMEETDRTVELERIIAQQKGRVEGLCPRLRDRIWTLSWLRYLQDFITKPSVNA